MGLVAGNAGHNAGKSKTITGTGNGNREQRRFVAGEGGEQRDLRLIRGPAWKE